MKFLFCGLGSIGQRHARLLRQILGDKVELMAYRSRGLDLLITDQVKGIPGKSPETEFGIRRVANFESGLAEKPDAVFITNPISLHLTTARAAIEAGCSVFIEKPLGHELALAKEVETKAREKKVTGFVGYQLRFHPALKIIREKLQDDVLGRLLRVNIEFGEWLPGMHDYENYRESHAARADQGGGVIACLSHEIDYACWLFGAPRRVYAQGGHLSNLEMDVEDVAVITQSHEVDGRPLPVQITLDFLSRPTRRNCFILGEKGHIEWCYSQPYLTIYNAETKRTEQISFPHFVRNQMFIEELEHFIQSVSTGTPSLIPLADGIKTMEACLAAQKSMATHQPVMLD